MSAFAALCWSACGGDGPTTPSTGLTAPTLAAPGDDSIVQSPTVLRVHNASSSVAGARSYDIQLADSQSALVGAPSGLLASAAGVPEGTAGDTEYVVQRDLPLAKRYYWRARAVQAGAPGPWSETFRFRTDFPRNNPPVLESLTSSSNRAEVNAEVVLTAVAKDDETPPANLTYEWSALGGTFTGTGATVRWRAPAGNTPTSYLLTLTIVERYTETDPDGRSVTRENRTVGTTEVHVNDSNREMTDLALTFLDDFVHDDRSPEFCVRNFSDNCRGKRDELGDIRAVRASQILDPGRSSFSVASITYDTPAQPTFATVLAPCRFASTSRATGIFGFANGTCRLTGVYENWRWFLCESNFLTSSGVTTFSRAFRFSPRP